VRPLAPQPLGDREKQRPVRVIVDPAARDAQRRGWSRSRNRRGRRRQRHHVRPHFIRDDARVEVRRITPGLADDDVDSERQRHGFAARQAALGPGQEDGHDEQSRNTLDELADSGPELSHDTRLAAASLREEDQGLPPR
jgi:hypothetical protein